MRSVNTEIDQKDYETYKIPISIGNLLPKAKNKYIWGELEKRHPCFSNDFYYFTKDKLTKKGLMSDVFVIEKSKLFEYKKKINKGKLLISGKKLTKWYESKNSKIIIYSLILIFLCIFIFLININKKESIDIVKNEVEENAIIDFEKIDTGCLSKLLETVQINKGLIRKLTWTLAMGGEFITGTIDNLYPEILENAVSSTEIKSTKYIEEKPFFDFAISNNFAMEGDNYENSKVSSDARESIRKILKKDNIKIIEEIIKPYRIIFTVLVDNKLKTQNVLTEINTNLEINNLYIKSINFSINKGMKQNPVIMIDMNITDSKLYKNNVLKILSRYLDCFYNNSVIESTILKKNDFIQQEENIIILGEVIDKDGRKKIFYRSEGGKILSKEVL